MARHTGITPISISLSNAWGSSMNHSMPRRARVCLLSARNQCRHRGQLHSIGHRPVPRRRPIWNRIVSIVAWNRRK